MSQHSSREASIIYFDGVCGLCNNFVNWVIARDTSAIFKYSPLQGETAQVQLSKIPENERLDSIILQNEEGLHFKSTAVLKVLAKLGGIWRIVSVLIYVPKCLRDTVYGFIARNRYRWFGKRDVCRMPEPHEEERFLK